MSTGAHPHPRRRRRLGGWALFIFVVVPLVEIYVLIQVGQVIGAWWTIAAADRRQHPRRVADPTRGPARLAGLTEALESGRMPARELADGALILIGGTLMLTPGFVSDVVGTVRDPAVHPAAGAPGADPRGRPAPGRRDAARGGRRPVPVPTRRPGPEPGPVVQGEVVDDDEERQATFLVLALARCRCAGPISPPRSSSRRSLRMSSSSFTERRSSSMSQWVRTGFSALSSGWTPSTLERVGAAARALPEGGHVRLDGHRDLERRAPAGTRSRPADEQRTRCRARPRNSGHRAGLPAVCAPPLAPP